MRTGEFPMHFTGDMDLRVRRFWTIAVGGMTTPPLGYVHVWGSRPQEEDHNFRPEISFTGVDGSAHGRKQEGVFSLIIAGAYKEDRNSELEITFTSFDWSVHLRK
ncbi:hypothetical protein TWF225_001038 [Orbilia oligospora]|nr:hypothetical protein TWF225_001038 [Orbilia oligospora]KAF3237866.1 hypothetical protein TWF128_000752 [Orbilia oligospora]KAF3238444.1 hypothetical protein TWF217_001717 [Orbilia oligospora]KAF3283019.1 hypothetical protein TWF132_010416 [Orbilia oligospora]